MRASSADIEKAMGIVADVARMRGELDAVKAENERLRARLAEAERLLDDAICAMLETECVKCNAAFVKAQRKRQRATDREKAGE